MHPSLSNVFASSTPITSATGTFTYKFDTPSYKGTVVLNTRLFINGTWVDPVDPATIEVVNPVTGQVVTKVAVGSSKDVDCAVSAAQKAYKTVWGLRCPGAERGKLINKLADLIEQHFDEFAALEALDAGKILDVVKNFEIPFAIATLRYYAGWADKVIGKVIETHTKKFAYTRLEPYGVVGAIVPWNLPIVSVTSDAQAVWALRVPAQMISMLKLGPALATGNTVILKVLQPSEVTPLTALRTADLMNEAGFPPGVVNVVNGSGRSVGQAMAEHRNIEKISFTGSGPVGRRIMKASAETNLKNVTLELGGKGPTIIFDDADLEEAVKWAAHGGIYFNMGQSCVAGSRIFVQDTIYDQFIAKFTNFSQELTSATGDPFAPGVQHGPQISQTYFDRIMDYIRSGKEEGANLHLGGERHGTEGYFIKPTIFTDTKPSMRIVQEEIFGPVSVLIKFTTEEEVIEAAKNTSYGLACHVFSENISRALRVTHEMEAGTVWVNCAVVPEVSMPWGGYKQSGIGREFGENAIHAYTQVKAVHINLGAKL